MSSRFNNPPTTRTSSLFAAYDAQHPPRTGPRTASASPARTPAHTLHPKKSDDPAPRASSAFGAYPGANPYSNSGNPYAGANGGPAITAGPGRDGGEGYRAATPNRRGQYSDAVLSELESQNEDELGTMSQKVRMLKDLTTSIGDEIRSSSALADAMNDGFENTRARLKGTMARMLRMAESTGVGWRAWVGFFAAVCCLFYYVWLF